MNNPNAILYEKIKAVCPVVGVSVGNWTDKGTWRIDFDTGATPAQKAAAQAVVDAFDYNAPDDTDEINQRVLNAALIEPGSVLRAIAEIQFGMIKGTIPVDPTMTLAQYRTLVKSKMG
jgi:hypothetical protein